MVRSKLHELFDQQLQDVLASKGTKCLPNVKLVEDPQEALNLINRATAGLTGCYNFRIQEFDPPKDGIQTHQNTWYPKIFLNGRGMGGRFDGSGVILASVGHQGQSAVFTFAMCEHSWDQSGANHSRGWHPAVCTKCGFDASIDSGD